MNGACGSVDGSSASYNKASFHFNCPLYPLLFDKKLHTKEFASKIGRARGDAAVCSASCAFGKIFSRIACEKKRMIGRFDDLWRL